MNHEFSILTLRQRRRPFSCADYKTGPLTLRRVFKLSLGCIKRHVYCRASLSQLAILCILRQVLDSLRFGSDEQSSKAIHLSEKLYKYSFWSMTQRTKVVQTPCASHYSAMRQPNTGGSRRGNNLSTEATFSH